MEFIVVMPVIILILLLLGSSSVDCQRPSVVKVGAVFTFNSVIGKAAKVAMELAVSDINADPRILNGTQLKLIVEDVECNVFLGSMKGMVLNKTGLTSAVILAENLDKSSTKQSQESSIN